MNHLNTWEQNSSIEHSLPIPHNLGQVVNELCDKALEDAKSQLHPLLQNIELERLDQRGEFVQAFKSALEQRIARKLAIWLPSIQAVFKYDEMPIQNIETWDGSIHLLVKVPCLSEPVKTLGKNVDKGLVKYFNQLGWPRLSKCPSILEVQQVTPNEIRHGISYGAMFCAVYNAPIKVWPPKRRVR